jgi:hypothetical protein
VRWLPEHLVSSLLDIIVASRLNELKETLDLDSDYLPLPLDGKLTEFADESKQIGDRMPKEYKLMRTSLQSARLAVLESAFVSDTSLLSAGRAALNSLLFYADLDSGVFDQENDLYVKLLTVAMYQQFWNKTSGDEIEKRLRPASQ